MSEAKSNNLRIGDLAPNFKAQTTKGDIDFHEYLGDSWGVLFSHPADFTPVCTTELGRVAALKDEWAKRNVKVIALSVDTLEHHEKWIPDINEVSKVDVQYPLIADHDRKVATLYGMLDQTEVHYQTGLPLTVRSVFVITPEKKIVLILTYPAATGRNFDEILRAIDSLQLAVSHKLATPVDWKKGDDAIILPSVSDEDAKTNYPKGFTKVKPYLRTTPDPRD